MLKVFADGQKQLKSAEHGSFVLVVFTGNVVGMQTHTTFCVDTAGSSSSVYIAIATNTYTDAIKWVRLMTF